MHLPDAKHKNILKRLCSLHSVRFLSMPQRTGVDAFPNMVLSAFELCQVLCILAALKWNSYWRLFNSSFDRCVLALCGLLLALFFLFCFVF